SRARLEQLAVPSSTSACSPSIRRSPQQPGPDRGDRPELPRFAVAAVVRPALGGRRRRAVAPNEPDPPEGNDSNWGEVLTCDAIAVHKSAPPGARPSRPRRPPGSSGWSSPTVVVAGATRPGPRDLRRRAVGAERTGSARGG